MEVGDGGGCFDFLLSTSVLGTQHAHAAADAAVCAAEVRKMEIWERDVFMFCRSPMFEIGVFVLPLV